MSDQIHDHEKTEHQDVDKTTPQVDLCEEQLQEWKDKYTRILADYDNYRRRVTRDEVQRIAYAQSDILLNLLSLADDFDRALASVTADDVHMLVQGFKMMRATLTALFERYGVVPMTDYTHFNPEFHEAIAQVESAQVPSGDIAEILQKGYLRHGKVLRVARVTVAR